MKSINHYLKSAAITILPNPLKHINTLRVEINPIECKRNGYNETFNTLLEKLRKDCGFSVSIDVDTAFNQTDRLNIMEIVLPLYANEAEIAKDIAEEVEECFGSVVNRVTIKKELRK